MGLSIFFMDGTWPTFGPSLARPLIGGRWFYWSGWNFSKIQSPGIPATNIPDASVRMTKMTICNWREVQFQESDGSITTKRKKIPVVYRSVFRLIIDLWIFKTRAFKIGTRPTAFLAVVPSGQYSTYLPDIVFSSHFLFCSYFFFPSTPPWTILFVREQAELSISAYINMANALLNTGFKMECMPLTLEVKDDPASPQYNSLK